MFVKDLPILCSISCNFNEDKSYYLRIGHFYFEVLLTKSWMGWRIHKDYKNQLKNKNSGVMIVLIPSLIALVREKLKKDLPDFYGIYSFEEKKKKLYQSWGPSLCKALPYAFYLVENGILLRPWYKVIEENYKNVCNSRS